MLSGHPSLLLLSGYQSPWLFAPDITEISRVNWSSPNWKRRRRKEMRMRRRDENSLRCGSPLEAAWIPGEFREKEKELMFAHAKLLTCWRSWIPIIISFNHSRYRTVFVGGRISPFSSCRWRSYLSESHLICHDFESVSFLLVTSFQTTWLPWPSLWLDMADGTLEIFLFFFNALLSIS